jgi:hypothetical protein
LKRGAKQEQRPLRRKRWWGGWTAEAAVSAERVSNKEDGHEKNRFSTVGLRQFELSHSNYEKTVAVEKKSDLLLLRKLQSKP